MLGLCGVCSYVYLVKLRGGDGTQLVFTPLISTSWSGPDDNQNLLAEYGYEVLQDSERLPPHLNVLPVLHSFIDNASELPGWDFDPDIVNPRTSFVVMQMCSCSLKSILRAERQAGRGIKDARARRWLRGVLSAVQHLKEHGIAHRDVKLDNVMLLDAYGPTETAVLIGFGMHLDFRKFGLTPLKLPLVVSMTRGGAPIAVAPEIHIPRPGPTTVLDYEHNDSWAVGMMFHELLSPPELTPFPDMMYPATYADDDYRHAAASHPTTQPLSPELRNLVRGLLRVEPSQRLSAKDALSHVVLGGAGE